ncbi:MAG: hypothetical protein BWY69_01725 [Planctomycetes bacterium ADurb.Bin401]|nr:MAG: hypothetical protein BWY69_01725 [Planctomycetes bacterium ADurb.Bin401]
MVSAGHFEFFEHVRHHRHDVACLSFIRLRCQKRDHSVDLADIQSDFRYGISFHLAAKVERCYRGGMDKYKIRKFARREVIAHQRCGIRAGFCCGFYRLRFSGHRKIFSDFSALGLVAKYLRYSYYAYNYGLYHCRRHVQRRFDGCDQIYYYGYRIDHNRLHRHEQDDGCADSGGCSARMEQHRVWKRIGNRLVGTCR